MKGMKGRLLKKLKSISTITALRQNIVFQANPSNQTFHASTFGKDQADHPQNTNPKQAFTGGSSSSSISAAAKVNQLIKDDDDETQNFEPFPDWRGQEVPSSKDHPEAPIACTVPLPGAQHLKAPEICDGLLETNNILFNREEPPSEGLSGSKTVAPFEVTFMGKNNSTNEEAEEEENGEFPSLLDFEEKCPPGGGEAVILYTTSLRGIRKTFEDCSSIRFLLESFRVLYTERDVSMHLEFREELWRILGGRVVPPRLFIRGRHVGGADEVVGLHEQGRLKKLLREIPLIPFNNGPCSGCGGARFVVCFNCNGSRKIIPDELNNGLLLSLRCPECNENGLVKCPICCC